MKCAVIAGIALGFVLYVLFMVSPAAAAGIAIVALAVDAAWDRRRETLRLHCGRRQGRLNK